MNEKLSNIPFEHLRKGDRVYRYPKRGLKEEGVITSKGIAFNPGVDSEYLMIDFKENYWPEGILHKEATNIYYNEKA